MQNSYNFFKSECGLLQQFVLQETRGSALSFLNSTGVRALPRQCHKPGRTLAFFKSLPTVKNQYVNVKHGDCNKLLEHYKYLSIMQCKKKKKNQELAVLINHPSPGVKENIRLSYEGQQNKEYADSDFTRFPSVTVPQYRKRRLNYTRSKYSQIVGSSPTVQSVSTEELRIQFVQKNKWQWVLKQLFSKISAILLQFAHYFILTLL